MHAPSTLQDRRWPPYADCAACERLRAAFSNLQYLGQFQKVYLLFEQGEELILVDQHAAAERVLYMNAFSPK